MGGNTADGIKGKRAFSEAMAAEPAKKARLPHPTTTTDYGDLLSDSDEGSLSIDSGGM